MRAGTIDALAPVATDCRRIIGDNAICCERAAAYHPLCRIHSQYRVSLVRQDPIAIGCWRPSSTCAKRSRCGNNNCNLATNRAQTVLEKRVPAMAAGLNYHSVPLLKRQCFPVYPATAQGIGIYDYLDKLGAIKGQKEKSPASGQCCSLKKI